MSVPEVKQQKLNKRKIIRNVRRNTLILVGVGVGVGIYMLSRKIDVLHEDITELNDALNDLVQEAFPIALEVDDS